MAVTLKDIGDKLGLSVNTVSRALRGKTDISEKNRLRIQETAAAMGYRPDMNARSLVLKRTNTIGLAVTESGNPVRMELCEKLRNLAGAEGYRLLQVSLPQDWAESKSHLIEELLSRNVDGLILGSVSAENPEENLNGLLRNCFISKCPVVLFGQIAHPRADCVEIRWIESAYRLTNHILERGYGELAFAGDSRAGEIFKGYAAAMTDAGLADKIRQFNFFANRIEDAYQGMNALLEEGVELPRGIIAPNDLGALGIMAALREHGISIPEQCAVAGIDNIEFGRFSSPPLTTIGFDNGECARTIWKLMSDRIENKQAPFVHIPLYQKLIIRKST